MTKSNKKEGFIMKKVLAVVLALVIVLSMTACGASKDDGLNVWCITPAGSGIYWVNVQKGVEGFCKENGITNYTLTAPSETANVQQKIELFSYNGIGQKAAFWLLLRYRKTGKTCVAIPGSVTKWALQMNVSRPSLHRELKKMEENGLIRYSSKQIEILKPDGLEEMLGE